MAPHVDHSPEKGPETAKGRHAFVTLITSDSYIPGALVLAKSIKATGSKHPLAVLVVQNSVSSEGLDILRHNYDYVIPVPELRSNQPRELHLLGRMELDVTFTKIHAWNPDYVPFEKIAFLDADVLVLENIDNIFEYLRDDIVFAAAPDVGWPDCFNSGVFVSTPSYDLYNGLMEHAKTKGSFDGGDQGLLNAFFCSWAGHINDQTRHAPKSARLPFTYNVTPTAFYSYLPALVHYNPRISCVHFIGETKPWLWERFADGGVVPRGNVSSYTLEMIKKWWDVFDTYSLNSQLALLPCPAIDWKNYKRPLNFTGSFVPNEEFQVMLSRGEQNSQTPSDLGNYKISWDPNEVKDVQIMRSRSPEKRSNSSKPRGRSPKKRTNSGASIVSNTAVASSSKFEDYKIAWDPKTTSPPKPRPKSPEKGKSPLVATPSQNSTAPETDSLTPPNPTDKQISASSFATTGTTVSETSSTGGSAGETAGEEGKGKKKKKLFGGLFKKWGKKKEKK